jgi:hypothetical protein
LDSSSKHFWATKDKKFGIHQWNSLRQRRNWCWEGVEIAGYAGIDLTAGVLFLIMETEDELHPIEIYQESDQLNGYGTVFTYS